MQQYILSNPKGGHLGSKGSNSSTIPTLNEALSTYFGIPTVSSTCTYSSSFPIQFLLAAAAYQYYRSRSQAHSAQRRGKSGILKVARRRHERLIRVSFTVYVLNIFHLHFQKRNARESALMTNKKVTQEL